MKIELTKHAVKRAHQRLSLKKRAVQRSATLALMHGHTANENDPWVLGNQPSITSGREIRTYGNAYYVFEYSRNCITLITLMLANCSQEGGAHEYAN